jgi:hypothetical protein
MSIAIRLIRSDCCARATSGQVTTVPPTSVMNSRRCMFAPRLKASYRFSLGILKGLGDVRFGPIADIGMEVCTSAAPQAGVVKVVIPRRHVGGILCCTVVRTRMACGIFLLPGQFKRQKRPGARTTLALAIAVAFVGDFQTKALRILLQTAGHAPSAIGTALLPAAVRSPNRLRTFTARKREIRTVGVIPPGRRAFCAKGSSGNHRDAK